MVYEDSLPHITSFVTQLSYIVTSTDRNSLQSIAKRGYADSSKDPLILDIMLNGDELDLLAG